MMLKSYKIAATLLLGLSLFMVSCFKDLDTVPLNDFEITSANVYDDPSSYRGVLAKLYAGLAVSGQQGPAGQPDISGIDEGFSTYLRQYWKAQELTTDEAVIAWNDGTIQDFHAQRWDANNEFVTAMYNRIFYQISLCNEFIRETTDEKLSTRGVSGAQLDEIKRFRAEARFLRALSYWHALDMFRAVPFVTEADAVGSFFPPQASPEQIFNYVESELKAIEEDLAPPRTNQYGRADRAAAWMVLAKLYLNAEVYLNRPRYNDCVQYCERIINAGYTLEPEYANMFMADNDRYRSGAIFSVLFDGLRTQTFGGMTFVCHAAVGGSMSPADFGLDFGWGGTRVTSNIVDKFPATGGSVVVAPNPGGTYPVIYVPGAYQGWTPATANQLSSPGANDQYEGYIFFPEAGSEFKFTAGPSWDVNWGDNGANGTLDPNGDNIKVSEAGFYKINVNLNNFTYTLLKTEWGLIGSATPDGWGSDQDMTYDASANAWTITLNLVAGEIKFRANDSWSLNYGDNAGNALLQQDGANIPIPANGTYKISLFLAKPDYTYSIERPLFDRRAMFYTDGQTRQIDDISQFTNGYAVAKFTNKRSDGMPGSDPTFVDTDFHMFRIEDVYLMYAEATLRGGGGSLSQALNYVNQIRTRAYKSAGANISQNELTLDFILDERARELYWECHRRTDLIRYGRFSESTYLWPWKGGVPEGVSRPRHLDVFPIPNSDIGANPNLRQNNGY